MFVLNRCLARSVPAVRLRFFVVAMLSVFLAGCASTFSATVTQFQAWPEHVQEASYRIVAQGGQINNLEFEAVADAVRASLGAIGLVQAEPRSPARFDIHLEYGTTVTQSVAPGYAGPFPDGWAMGGYYGGWPGVFYAPPVVNYPVQVNKNTLSVRITDAQSQGREVYRSSALNFSDSENFIQVMPWLVRAVFDNFPGNNGQVRDITYERRRH